jgi:hypothetical protein
MLAYPGHTEAPTMELQFAQPLVHAVRESPQTLSIERAASHLS